jgi:peptidyl-prolyl cis-trans isomerase B (cyclophilin B)
MIVIRRGRGAPVASSRERERKLARAKIERQMARRAERTAAQRRMFARVLSGVAVLLVAVLVFTFVGGWHKVFGGKSKTNAASDSTTTCVWAPDTTQNPSLKDVGTPPTDKIATTGTDTMTMTTNQGVVGITLDRSTASCATASFEYLAGKKFFDNTTCTGMTTAPTYLLRCGSPTADGRGGPTYTFAMDNQPGDVFSAPSNAPSPSPGSTAPSDVVYPAGTVAMAHDPGQPDANGSQFFIVYKDTTLTPQYSVVGNVATGLDVVTKIAAGGTTGTGETAKPKLNVTIVSLTVTADSPTSSPAPSTPASPTPTVAPTPSGSAASKS